MKLISRQREADMQLLCSSEMPRDLNRVTFLAVLESELRLGS